MESYDANSIEELLNKLNTSEPKELFFQGTPSRRELLQSKNNPLEQIQIPEGASKEQLKQMVDDICTKIQSAIEKSPKKNDEYYQQLSNDINKYRSTQKLEDFIEVMFTRAHMNEPLINNYVEQISQIRKILWDKFRIAVDKESVMNRQLLQGLNQNYVKKGLDFMQALKVWREANINPDQIVAQVKSDIDRTITAEEANELYHVGASMQYDYDYVAKPFEVSKGREDLIPENAKQTSVRFTPMVRQSLEKIGENLYRDKKAAKYWTLKEKLGDNGEKAIFLVAVEEPEKVKK
jgi:hypothetical protein